MGAVKTPLERSAADLIERQKDRIETHGHDRLTIVQELIDYEDSNEAMADAVGCGSAAHHKRRGDALREVKQRLEKDGSHAEDPAWLRLEVEKLRAVLDERRRDFEKVYIQSLTPTGVGFQMGLHGQATMLTASMLAAEFKAGGGENYITLTFSHPELGPMALNIQRTEGELPAVKAARLKRELEAAGAMLTKARDQFLSYEAQHRAKGTPEADRKADVNLGLAVEIQCVLDGKEAPASASVA